MDAFSALAEPNRRRVVEILAHSGRLSATQICDQFDVTPQAISQHLRVLREADILRMERRAQLRIYAFNPKSLFEVEKWAANVSEMWKSRLDSLDLALKNDEESTRGEKSR